MPMLDELYAVIEAVRRRYWAAFKMLDRVGRCRCSCWWCGNWSTMTPAWIIRRSGNRRDASVFQSVETGCRSHARGRNTPT